MKRFPEVQIAVFVLHLFAAGCAAYAQTLLEADGTAATYTLIENALGTGTADETPDCAHPQFGPHILQRWDDQAGKYVFSFFIHAAPDDDRCLAGVTDRQRNEIKTFAGSPAYVKGDYGDTCSYRWYFKLDAGFQPSPNFTHLHQIKAGDGSDAELPLITITPRSSAPEKMEIIYIAPTASGGNSTVLTSANLSVFKGQWIEANERILYATNGTYELTLRRVSDGAVLLACTNSHLNLWRAGATFNRPKWGIYRSLLSPGYLRDEEVRFADFCITKGEDRCPDVPPSITRPPADQAVFPGQSGAFTAAANGTLPLHYRWRRDATNILEWATNATLILTNTVSQNAGEYSVVVSNSYGAVTSSAAVLSFSTAGTNRYREAGTHTWVCPPGITAVQVECWGGGGAGGSAIRPVSPGVGTGGGGAGGAYAKCNSYPVTPGAVYYIHVGTGGESSVADGQAVAGGDSWFNSADEASSLILAKGGAGGESVLASGGSKYGAGGAGSSSGSMGDVVYAGGSGATSTANSYGGGGGGSGGPDSAGRSALADTGIGAAAVSGGGNGGDANPTGGSSGSGQTPSGSPGGGGGGARSGSTVQQTGGAGAAGQVVLMYAIQPGPVDSVGDGVPDWWRAQYFGGDGKTTNAESASTADSDRDGISNLNEYLADTNPTDSASRLALTGLTAGENNIQLTWTGGSGVWQIVEFRESLTDTNGWTAVYTNVPPMPVTNTANFTASNTALFYRIKAGRQP